MKIIAQPLSAQAFSPYGDVIEANGKADFTINEGAAQRFHDLAQIDVDDNGGRALVSIARSQPVALPLNIKMMERHPLGSQIFMPLSQQPFLVVVSKNDERGRPGRPVAFIARSQGINYAKNAWHHPLVALEAVSDFLVVDRGGEGDNLEEYIITEASYTVCLD